MAQSTDINLPRSHTPQFPNRCVVCDRDQPESYVRHPTGTLGWWSWLFWWLNRPFIAKAPACPGCVWKHHGRRFISLLLTGSVGFVVLWLVWPHFKDEVPQEFRRWAMMALVVLFILPQVLYEVLFAAPFDVTAYPDSVDYEFASIDYAVEFASLNHDAQWVKVNGDNILQ